VGAFTLREKLPPTWVAWFVTLPGWAVNIIAAVLYLAFVAAVAWAARSRMRVTCWEEHNAEDKKARAEQREAMGKIVRDAKPGTPATQTADVDDLARLVADLVVERDALKVSEREALAKQATEHTEALTKQKGQHDAAIATLAKEHTEALTKQKGERDEAVNARKELAEANIRQSEGHAVALRDASVDCERRIDKAIVDAKKAWVSHPLEECLYFEPYVEVDAPFSHRATFLRGGLPSECEASVRFGLRATNHGALPVRVREIQWAKFSLALGVAGSPAIWTIEDRPIKRDNGAPVVVPAGCIQVHVCNVVSPEPNTTLTVRPYYGTPLFGSVQIHALLLVHGEWGPEARPYEFMGSAPIAVEFKYTREVQRAVDRLRWKLHERNIELVDANLSYGVAPTALRNASVPPGLGWGVALQPSVVAHFGGFETTPEACTEAALDKVVELAEARMRDELTKRGGA
jgi:hypothetical protein